MPNGNCDIQQLKNATRPLLEMLQRVQELPTDTLIPVDDVRPFLDIVRVFFYGGHKRMYFSGSHSSCLFSGPRCHLDSDDLAIPIDFDIPE